MENDYKTMDPDFMESIWWVFKDLWDKNLIYQGYKSMHICPRCGTTLSNFEVTQGYKDIKDISVTVKFELEDEPGTYLLAWTTTPWTLIGNVALAVGKDIDYVKLVKTISGEKEELWVASDLVNKFLSSPQKGEPYDIFISNKITKGKDLVGKKYKPLFDYYFKDEKLENKENGWKIYAGDFVTTAEGTGVVHIAPAFGEDDMELGKKYNLPFVQHVDIDGRFCAEVKEWAGEEVKPKDNPRATDKKIVAWLKKNNKLFAAEEYEHSYPHCWRCDTPLLNYAAESWFVKVTEVKKDLLTNNKLINWIPEHIKDGRFGKWLEQARDWAISRNRYWGTPLPVWVCQSCEERRVVGSREELNKLSGQNIDDLHKQFVDKIEFNCEKCKGIMKRIPEVLDCWFESGSMPYAQEHYPFANKDKFEKNFPADFVAEGVDQTRGWFYTLHVLATALKIKNKTSPAFKNVIVNGIVLAEDGQKMSKRLNNYPDPAELIEKYSVDAMRYYLLSSPVLSAENLNFSEEGVKETLRKTSLILWNVYKFYALYATDAESEDKATASNNVLDKWILAKLNQLIKTVTESMDAYLIPRACRPIEVFINDLSTWYLRRSRSRFKGEDEDDKQAALVTSKFVLSELAKIMAPFTPFLAEQLWQQVNNYNFSDLEKSVHLEIWSKDALVDKEVLANMEIVRKIVELGLAARDEAGIKVRQPLARLEVKTKDNKLAEEYLGLIMDEVNIKEVVWVKGEGEIKIKLETKLTPELEAEGAKRELVRLINAMRKKLGLTITDRVAVYWQTDEKTLAEIIKNNTDALKQEVLAKEIKIKATDDNFDLSQEVKVNQSKAWLGIKIIK